jgi:hypothetical protein
VMTDQYLTSLLRLRQAEVHTHEWHYCDDQLEEAEGWLTTPNTTSEESEQFELIVKSSMGQRRNEDEEVEENKNHSDLENERRAKSEE